MFAMLALPLWAYLLAVFLASFSVFLTAAVLTADEI
jgi:hypothetical protein